ncbi:hypothetical protein PLEOSDRAFT_1086465 [Pleurotus ostreatus PC15]|uniref:Uncharacterized protein n=1 Tax=Pleurotus ostreatus (strain PC15) TaxID=1137138 RepID=A0A067NB43_PLEO1|nr:hypothetical protein PLEOSDRAFT_1086465 [Pleurotus ostreatus PC15]
MSSKPTVPSFESYDLYRSEILVYDTEDTINAAVDDLVATARPGLPFGIAIAVAITGRVRVISIATLRAVSVFDVTRVATFPDALRAFLGEVDYVKIGVDVYDCARALYRTHAVRLRGAGEISRLHRVFDSSGAAKGVPFGDSISLKHACEVWLNLTIEDDQYADNALSPVGLVDYHYFAVKASATLTLYWKMQDVPLLDAIERSFWIFDDIDHNTGRPDGLRPDYAPYAVHDPRHINQIAKSVEEIRKTVSLRPGHDLPNPVPPLDHAHRHRVIQLVVRVRVRPLHAGPLTIRTVRWIVIGIILIRTGPIADDDPSLRVRALPNRTPTLRHPRLLTDDRIYYALYPLETLDMGTLFKFVSVSGEELLDHIYKTPRGTYALAEEVRQDWERLELLLKGIGDHLFLAYRSRHRVYGPALHITMPSVCGYRDIGPRDQVYKACVETVHAFKLLSAYVSFTLALWYGRDALDPLAEAQAEILKSPLGIDLPQWQLIYMSVLCRFGPGLRVGGFVDPYRTFWGHSFARLARADVSIWLLWGRERHSLVLDPAMRTTYYPPAHILSAAKLRPIGMRIGAVVLAEVLASHGDEAPSNPLPPSGVQPVNYPQDPPDWTSPPEYCFQGEDEDEEYIPYVWKKHCELYLEKEISARARIDDTPGTPEHTALLLEKVQQIGHVTGTRLHVWRYHRALGTYQRHIVPDLSVGDHWPDYRPVCRFYWPCTREWDLVPFTAPTPPGAVVCSLAQYDANAYFFPDKDASPVPGTQSPTPAEDTSSITAETLDEPMSPTASPPPSSSAASQADVPIPDARPILSLESYLRQRHGYDLNGGLVDESLYTPSALPPDSPIAQQSLGYRHDGRIASDVTAAAVDWHNTLINPAVQLSRLPSRWDLHPSSPLVTKHSGFTLRKAWSPNSCPIYLLGSPPDSLKPAFWSLALFNATAVLYVYRTSTSSDLVSCARELLQAGIPFRTVIKREPGSPPLLAKPDVGNPLLQIRSQAKEEPRQCYYSYVRIRDGLLKTPVGRAARLRAGILGLLALRVVPDEDVFSGPVYADQLVAIDGSAHYFDDSLSDNVSDTLVGAFYFGGAETALRSYWPRPSQWDKSRYGGDQWNYDGITYVQRREEELEDDAARMKPSTKWVSTLKRKNSDGDVVRDASDNLASSFISHILSPPHHALYHHRRRQRFNFTNTLMTQLRIIRDILSTQRATRKRLIKATKSWLRSPGIQRAVSRRLGFPVHTLDRWVIVQSRHCSISDPVPHITLRGYRQHAAVATVHIYVDDLYVRQGSGIYPTGAPIVADTDCIARVEHFCFRNGLQYFRQTPRRVIDLSAETDDGPFGHPQAICAFARADTSESPLTASTIAIYPIYDECKNLSQQSSTMHYRTLNDSYLCREAAEQMTQLRIIRQLLCKRKEHRERLIQTVTQWLGSKAIPRAISARLGYPVQELNSWVIVRERHSSNSDRIPHITLRGYRRKRGVVTVHIYVTEQYVREGTGLYYHGAPIKAKTTCVLSNVDITSHIRETASRPEDVSRPRNAASSPPRSQVANSTLLHSLPATNNPKGEENWEGDSIANLTALNVPVSSSVKRRSWRRDSAGALLLSPTASSGHAVTTKPTYDERQAREWMTSPLTVQQGRTTPVGVCGCGLSKTMD